MSGPMVLSQPTGTSFSDNYVQNNHPLAAQSPFSYGGGIVNEFTGKLFDPGFRRPYLTPGGRLCVTINTGRWTVERGERVMLREQVPVAPLINAGLMAPVYNATALRKEEWTELDKKILLAARYRLRAWSDLASANTFGGFNGMSKMILEHETMSDPGEAIIDFNGLTEGRGDAPQYQLQGLPLPITHSDFWFDARRLAISRGSSGGGLDLAMGESAGRRVAETTEKLTVGVQTGPTYGGASTQVGGYGRTSSVYGYLNFPQRLLKTNLTTPTGSNASSTLANVLAMKDQLTANKFYGPWVLYHSADWDQYMDNDYILSGGNVATQTLRNRLKAIEGIVDVRRLDVLLPSANTSDPINISTANPFTLIMVQMTADVARAVDGMGITTVQWETKGGMMLNFKVMCIQVPQLRADHYGNCGILAATTS